MPTITLTTLQFPPSPTRIGEVRKAESEGLGDTAYHRQLLYQIDQKGVSQTKGSAV